MEFLLAGLKKCFEIAAVKLVDGWACRCVSRHIILHPQGDWSCECVFVKYVACPKCHALYEFDKCYHSVGTTRVSNKCSVVKFPNHRQRWRRQSCGASLLKEVTLKC